MPSTPVETVAAGEFQVPVRLAALTGCPPDTFESYGNAQFGCIQKYLKIGASDSVLEIGCGVGRLAIPCAKVVTSGGSYLGIDIIRDSIDWCSTHITRRYPHFRFHFEDVSSQLHNPGGVEHPASTSVPLPEGSVDKIFLTSVFTHMFPDGVDHYLREFKRVLRPGGLVLSTMFLLNDESREVIREGKTGWTFSHRYQDYEYCWLDSLEYIESAVAYEESAYVDMIRCHGMYLRHPTVYGTWSGAHRTDDGQDYVIFGPA